MEVKSCNVNRLSFYIWYESDKFLVEDMEANKLLLLSQSHLRWFVKNISELIQSFVPCFFLRNEHGDYGVTQLSKFRAHQDGLCIVLSGQPQGGTIIFMFLLEKKTSFLNSWSAIVNSGLLEECCVRVQILGFFPNKSVSSLPKSYTFTYSNFKIPGSSVHRGTSSIPSNPTQHRSMNQMETQL